MSQDPQETIMNEEDMSAAMAEREAEKQATQTDDASSIDETPSEATPELETPIVNEPPIEAEATPEITPDVEPVAEVEAIQETAPEVEPVAEVEAIQETVPEAEPVAEAVTIDEQPIETSTTNEALQNDTPNPDAPSVFSAVDNLASKLETIETFFARRFDEISMEINATSQQVDMAEEGIVGKFADVLEVLKAISFSGDGKTPANAGVELDAVVDITEDATNKILDQAQRTSELVADANIHWDDPAVRQKTIEQIEANMDEITMACSFQDITGQRIRTTLDNLHEIEERLNSALGKMGIVVEVAAPETQKTWVANQDDIDSLFE